jgi:hypothetical protein
MWTTITEEMNRLRTVKRKCVTKINGPVKEGECWRI